MNTYIFKVSKPSLFIFTIFFSLFGGVSLIILASMLKIFPEENIFCFILFFSGLIVLSILLLRFTSFAKIEVKLGNDSISIKWHGQFLFYKKKDFTLSFANIAAYVVQDDPNWSWLKIEMTDGNIYKMWHSNFLIRDDYSKFISAFVLSIEDYNSAIGISSAKDNFIMKPKTIKHAKTIYETTVGLILAGGAIVIIIGLPILLLKVPLTKEPNYFLLVLAYFGAIYFLIKVYTLRKKG